MINIDTRVADKRYYRRVRQIGQFCTKIIQNAWHDYEPAEISVLLTDDATIQTLNKQYRGKDCPTNVLSFENNCRPKDKSVPWNAGDIIMAYETVLREAKDQNKTFEAHLAHLLTHGALHLQGYDHIDLKDALKMERKETTLMKKLGYEDPYKDVI